MSQMFVKSVAELAEAYVSVKRLQSFLECDEMKHDTVTSDRDTSEADNNAISLTNLTAKWIVKENNLKSEKVQDTAGELSILRANGGNEQVLTLHQHHTLYRINLKIKKGSLVGIIGSVGSGNTSHLISL